MSNQQIVLSQNQKSSTVTLIFQNADFLAAVGDSLRVESFLHVTINQSTYDEFVKGVMASFVAEFMDFKEQWPIPQELQELRKVWTSLWHGMSEFIRIFISEGHH